MSVSRHKLRVWPRKTGENMQISLKASVRWCTVMIGKTITLAQAENLQRQSRGL